MAKVNIKDIALRAGVSKTAVSFAFNNPGRLSEATVKQILQIAEEMGYTPDPVARSMSTGRTGVIGLLVPQTIPEVVHNPFFPELIEGVGEVCAQAGLSLMLVSPLRGSMQGAVTNAAVDGFLTLGLEEHRATMAVLRRRGLPYVTIDSDPIEGIPAVNIDDEGGARRAMEHLLEMGHRHIAILSLTSPKHGHYQEYTGTLGARMRGYLTALEANDLKINGRSVRLLECINTEMGGAQGFETVWNSRSQPTGVVAMSDVVALGFMKAAQENQVSIPADVSIIGFDDIPQAGLICPPLTTISQPSREKGRLAASILVQKIEGAPVQDHHVLPTDLVSRGSVARILQ